MTEQASKSSSKPSGPIQFTTLNRWRRERAMLEVFLVNGQRLVGRVRSFDRFSMLLEMPQGGCFVFHHTVSTIQPASKARRPMPGKPARREGGFDKPAGRPTSGPRERLDRRPTVGDLVEREDRRKADAPVVTVVQRKRRIIQRDSD